MGATMRQEAAYGSRRRRFAAVARPNGCSRMAWRWRSLCATAGLLTWVMPTTVTGDDIRVFQPSVQDPLRSEECPASCRDVFSKLEWGPSPRGGEGYVQKLEVQERGGACFGSAVRPPVTKRKEENTKSLVVCIPSHSSRWVRLFGSSSSATSRRPTTCVLHVENLS